nr:MAG TPA: hypothetical protein [Caudoviricetes sp.]
MRLVLIDSSSLRVYTEIKKFSSNADSPILSKAQVS